MTPYSPLTIGLRHRVKTEVEAGGIEPARQWSFCAPEPRLLAALHSEERFSMPNINGRDPVDLASTVRTVRSGRSGACVSGNTAGRR